MDDYIGYFIAMFIILMPVVLMALHWTFWPIKAGKVVKWDFREGRRAHRDET